MIGQETRFGLECLGMTGQFGQGWLAGALGIWVCFSHHQRPDYGVKGMDTDRNN